MVPERDVRRRDVGDLRDEDHRALPAQADQQHDREHRLMAPARRINVDLPLLRHGGRALDLRPGRSCSRPGRPTCARSATGAYKLAGRCGSIVGVIGAFAVSRASVRLIEWMTVPAYAFTHRPARRAAGRARLGRGHGDEHVPDGSPSRGHRLGQPAEFAKLTVVLMLARVLAQNRVAPKSMIELWKPIARRRRAVAAHHGAGRPRHVDRVRRNLLRHAVLGRRAVAAAACCSRVRSSA